MARVLKESQFYLHTRRSSANGRITPAFVFPAEAGTHLPTPEGWKAELSVHKSYGLFWQPAFVQINLSLSHSLSPVDLEAR